MLKIRIRGLLLFLVLSAAVQGQKIEQEAGLKIDLNTTGTRYMRLLMWNQVWLRQIENNPGTAVNANNARWTPDISIRRARMMAFAQLGPRYLVLAHFGINNQTFTNGGIPFGGISGSGGTYTSGKKPALFFHDIWNEYAWLPGVDAETGDINKASFYTGFGLHAWLGLSRMSNASTLRFLMIDAPIFNWPTIEISDQFARQMGMYAKGHVGALSYRANLNRPFTTLMPPPVENGSKVLDVAVDNNDLNPWSTAAYVFYQFKDKEDLQLPFLSGTYLGSKSILNIGAGFYRSPRGTVSHLLQTNGDTTVARHDIGIWSLDLFVDLPFGPQKRWAFTAYSVFYNHQWGPNYYRTIGIMNEGSIDPNFTGVLSNNGPGNARPLLGTGKIWYNQAGVLLPRISALKQLRLQPFVAYTLHDLQRLSGQVHSYDAGMNLFLDGHQAKITFQYSARPLLYNKTQEGFLSEFLLQTQIFL